MNRRFFLSSLALGLTSCTAAALAQGAPAPAPLVVADQSELLRNLFEASGEGERSGLALQFPNFAGGPAILEAMRAGALDIAYVGDTPPIQARASGTLLPIVATFTRQVAEYHLVSRPGLVVEKLAELKGRKVSYVEGSGRQAFMIEALNRAGLTLNDVERVNLRVADLPDAIRSGAVDVAVLQEPFVTRLTKQVGAARVRDPEERRLLPSTSYICARPEVLADPAGSAAIGVFLAAFVRAGTWSNRNREAWGKEYYTGFQRLAPEETAAILSAQSPLVFQTSAEAVAHHQRLIDLLHQAGSLPRRFDAAGSFVDTFDPIIAKAR